MPEPTDQQPTGNDALAALRESIRQQTEEASQLEIEKRIEEEKDRIRRGGDGGIMGFIMGIVFQIAELLGLDGFLANLVGMPMPSDQEKTALSGQIADSVSQTLTAQEYANAQAAGTQVTQDTYAHLMRPENRRLTASFTDDQLREAAQAAGVTAAAEFGNLSQVYSGGASPEAGSNIVLTGSTKEEKIRSAAEQIISRLEHMAPLSAEAKERLIQTSTNLILQHEAEIVRGNTQPLAQALAQVVLEEPEIVERMNEHELLKIVPPEDRPQLVTAKILQELNGHRTALTTALTGQAAPAADVAQAPSGVDDDPLKKVIETMKDKYKTELRPEIQTKLTQTITNTAVAVLTGNASIAPDGALIITPEREKVAREITSITPAQIAEYAPGLSGTTRFGIEKFGRVNATRSNALALAQASGAAPNEDQIAALSTIITEEIVNFSARTIAVNQQDYESRLQQELAAKLTERASEIDNKRNEYRARNAWNAIGATWSQIANNVIERKGYTLTDVQIERISTTAARLAGEQFEDKIKPMQQGTAAFAMQERPPAPQSPDVNPGVPVAPAIIQAATPREVPAARR